MTDIGERLKELRERYGLSQRALARRAGVPNASVSMIERGQTSPSVSSLKKLLDCLDVTMAEFFAADPPTPQRFFRAEELVELGSGGLSFRQVGRDLRGRALQVLHERYAPGADTGPTMLSHRGEESGVVVAGRIELTVAGEARVLGPGDGYAFDSRLPHRFRNTGHEPAEVVSACTPPSF